MLKILLKKSIKIGIAILVCCFFIASSYYLYRYISNLPKKIISYEGISLGMDMSEVKYILGYPDSASHPEEVLNEGKRRLRLSQIFASKEDIERSPNVVNDFFDWQYEKGVKIIDIGFDSSTSKVTSIGCYVDERKFVDAGTCAVNGIQSLDKEEDIFRKLGTPSSSVIDNTTKTMVYSKYNMKINLVKKTAYNIIVQNY